MQQPEAPADLFRPSKRRKFYRKRDISDDEGHNNPVRSPQPPSSPSSVPIKDEPGLEETKKSDIATGDSDQEGLPISELLRQRKLGRRRLAGVEFSSAADLAAASPEPKLELVKREEDDTPDLIKAIGNRFAAQTGRVAEETNKHMMDFIDREIAKRTQKLLNDEEGNEDNETQADATSASPSGDPRFRNPTSQGKLHEIDLGESAKLLNIVRTEAAVSGAPVEPPPPKKKIRVRIGRNGKPYIPKPRPDRNRRNSADIARDKMVEDLLRENKLEVYDDGQEPALEDNAEGPAADAEGAADERMAEQFRKDFMDAMSQRRERSNKVPGPAGKTGEERPKGPKLGGSRNQRAAMREKEEAAKAAAAAKGRR